MMATAAKTQKEQAAAVEAETAEQEVAEEVYKNELASPGSEMVPAEPPSQPPATVASDFFGGFGKSAAVLHNFSGTAQQVWAKVARATGPTTKDAEDCVGKPIFLTHFYCHAVSIVDKQTGELFDNMPRIVLIDKSGAAWGFVSRGILDGLRMLLQSFSGVLPPEGIQIVVRRQKTRKGFYVFCIEPFDENVETA